MSNCKHRLISGMLTVLCLLTGLAAPAWSHTTEAPALAAASAPDLIIESLALSPESPSIGDMLAFTVTIKNQGDDRAAAEQLACLIDEHPLSTIPVEPVDAGATAVKTVTWKAQAGPHVFRAVIDSNDRVAESNENNNDKTYAFSVLAPDLTIDAISWTPAEPAVGDEVTFSIAVVNRGDKRAGVCHLDFSVDGNSRGYTPIYGVEAGASVNETYTWIATQGVHDVRADIDVFHQVTESDEANNSTEATCATALPDLTISSITMTPDVISENTTVVFYVDITNQGSSRAGSSSVTFYIEDSQKDSDFLGPLEPGATSTANFTWVAGGKPLTFKAVADAYNQIVESDKTNNTGTVVFPKFSPDLMIQDITWSPSSPVLTDFVTCTVTVKNQGKSMSNATQLNFVIDNARHYNALIPELSANTTTTAMFTFMTERLAHTVKASIDDDNLIKESDESNNTMTKTVISTKPVPTADLVVTSFTYSPARPVIGGNITVSLGVKNRGTGKATPTYAAFFFDSSPVDSVYINELEAGASLTKEVTLPLSGLPFKDTYKVKVLLDSHNTVWETDESNNEKEASFSIYAPDLVVQSVTWSPEKPSAGDKVTFYVTVKNRGDLEASSTYISYYIDKVYVGWHLIEDIEPGTTVTRPFTWTTQRGSFTFTAVADEANNILESDESNNTKTVSLPAPDLVIDRVTWSPANPIEFSPVTFTAVIKNQGPGQAPGTLLSCYIDGTTFLSFDTGAIDPGGTAEVAFAYAFQSGEHSIRLIADGNDAVTEVSEANNENTVRFSVQVQPTSALPAAPESANVTAPTTPAPVPTTPVIPGENLASGNNTPARDISSNITAGPPGWQNAVQNRWLIMGVAALGIGAIGVLLLIRRKSSKK